MRDEVEFPLLGKRVWVAGHSGMVGSALVRRLAREECEVVVVDRGSLDLMDQTATRAWIMETRPEAIFVAAARVGGILANDIYSADFLYNNLMIEANIMEAAYRARVSKLLFLGSSCIYPRLASQPISEDALLIGPLEPTNQWYAIAKIAGIKLCEAFRKQYDCNFISAMPTNLYGPCDNFDHSTSHVIPALMRKAHEAKAAGNAELVVWGTGAPRREFLYVDDCADACIHLMKVYSGESHINVGSGKDLTILELTKLICDVVGYSGALRHDYSKPDGTPRKLMDVERLKALGWTSRTSLQVGLAETYDWFKQNYFRLESRSVERRQ